MVIIEYLIFKHALTTMSKPLQYMKVQYMYLLFNFIPQPNFQQRVDLYKYKVKDIKLRKTSSRDYSLRYVPRKRHADEVD